MKQRLVLSLLSILALVYFAFPQLQMQGKGESVLFTWVWLGFCLIAFGGNLAGLLYRPANNREKQRERKMAKSQRREYRRSTSI